METASQTRFVGLLNRRARWGLSWRGWLTLFVLAALGLWLTVLNIYWFLAPTNRVQSKLLVIEGWVSTHTLRQAIAIYHKSGYTEIITTGSLLYESLTWENGFTHAGWAAEWLRRLGLENASITPVPGYEEQRDRTYHAALAVKQWLEQNRPTVTAIDLLTTGPHARRSQLLFQKALGPNITVGIISVPDPQYDPAHWWRSSQGVRDVLGETIAYLYAKIFFWPSAPAPVVEAKK